MADEQLELRWDPRPGDWGDALRAVTPMYRWSPWFAAALAVFGAVLVALGEPLPGVFGLGCAAVIAVLPMLAVNSSFRRNPVAAATVTATVDDSSMRMMTVDGTAYSDLRWSTLSGWLETNRGFVLRTGEATALFPVPNRAFGAQEERRRFRELLERTVGPAKP
ncbi:YcxB family protein [Actinophytocola sp.]|uniref:YcxB family protein n=1 Tax=Actinophytocola sp. TaxID=1872138 RepID=UPI0025C63EB7|nr:YcxB family protein [Actinophytocola sp.]